MNQPIVLIDGSSYLFRAYYALPALTNGQGHPTGAMLGVLNMLKRLLKQYDTEHVVMVFDAKGKNFRHTLYPDYKANRAKMPDDLRVQIEPLHQLIQWLGIPLIAVEGVEADDVIGTLTDQARRHGFDVVISTGDKDMAQLIQPGVVLIDTMKEVLMDHDYVMTKFGVGPELIIDLLALMGDSSDNIPGVPKVGQKTAAKWLNQYGSLDNLIAHADDITGKVGDNLRAHLDQLALNQQLTTIRRDMALDLTVEDFKKQPMQLEPLIDALTHWEFASWLKELAPEADSTEATTYHCITSQQDWQYWYDKLLASSELCFDTETTSLDPLQAQLVGISFSIAAKEAIYVPLQHDYVGVPEQLPFDVTIAQIKTLLENPDSRIIGQNLKYDIEVLDKYGIRPNNLYFDTMLASYVLNSGVNRHGMDALAQKYLNIVTTKYEEVVGKGAKQIGFNEVDLDTATHYAAEDADITFRLYQLFNESLAQIPALRSVFEQEEMPLIEVLTVMELQGVLIDVDFLNQQSQAHANKLVELEQQAHQIAGVPFNLGSPKQLREILYDKMQLPVVKKTPTGQASTNEEVLQDLAENHELPQVILQHRHLSKLKSTYTDKLPQQVDAGTGRIHTQYHQAIANTGRLSSSDPNLQNIPIRTDAGRQIRQAFIAPPGFQIVAADYSQIELRIMAHLSKDAGLLAAFNAGQDIHRATAAEVFSVDLTDVSQEQRRRAKAINFGLIYGMSAFGLAKQLHIGRQQAQQYIDTYFERYPGVLTYMETTREFAHENGYVETLFGRRLYLSEINASNMARRKAAERAAINAPMQGTAADIIKRAMIDLHHWLDEHHSGTNMIMQVHDELVFECQTENLSQMCQIIREKMCAAAMLDVELVVDIGVGANWDEAH